MKREEFRNFISRAQDAYESISILEESQRVISDGQRKIDERLRQLEAKFRTGSSHDKNGDDSIELAEMHGLLKELSEKVDATERGLRRLSEGENTSRKVEILNNDARKSPRVHTSDSD